MLACIPTNGNAGLDDTVCDHFGSAPCFTLIDSDTGEVQVLDNRNAHHSHGTCHPMNQLAHHRINAVVCVGMGRRAIEALNAEGIKIYHSGSTQVREVVEKIKAGELVEMDATTACRGHGQPGNLASDAGCGHGHGRGSGFGQGPGRGQGRGGFGQGGGQGRGGRQ